MCLCLKCSIQSASDRTIAWKSVFKNRAFRSYADNKEGRRAKLVDGCKQGFFCFCQFCSHRQVCRTKYSERCEEVPTRKCRNVRKCKKVPRDVCKTSHKKKCVTVSRRNFFWMPEPNEQSVKMIHRSAKHDGRLNILSNSIHKKELYL